MLIVSSGAQLDGVSWMYLIRYCQLDKDSMLMMMMMMMIMMMMILMMMMMMMMMMKMMMMILMMMMMKMKIVEQVLVPKVNYSLELIQAS